MSLQLSEEKDGRNLLVHASGKLTTEDYEHFVPEVDRLIKQHGKVNILFGLHDFHGWKAGALWADTKFAMTHYSGIARLALVGEKAWHKGMATFCKPFTRAEVRYFDKDDEEKALAWLREGQGAEKGDQPSCGSNDQQ
jgi:hypothetical protein